MNAKEYHIALVINVSIFLFTIPHVYAQENEEFELQTQDLHIIFGSFIAAITILSIYISRDVILRRKSRYDANEFDSQKNRDYEKYHSKWGDEWGWREDGQREFVNGKSPEYEYYEILGVKKNATKNEIKSKYRELAKKSHPDKNNEDNSDHMIMINRAYEVLSDKSLRKEYDQYLDNI
ncbi:MAG: heat shock protein DnaJ domain-containing protein [Cenarchaeum symbiont of Oopsacas minuta]|nr:heat shock protein DnaJ domain-containing protein [Cenarchaeum symbiont of Oopsacas minuta]